MKAKHDQAGWPYDYWDETILQRLLWDVRDLLLMDVAIENPPGDWDSFRIDWSWSVGSSWASERKAAIEGPKVFETWVRWYGEVIVYVFPDLRLRTSKDPGLGEVPVRCVDEMAGLRLFDPPIRGYTHDIFPMPGLSDRAKLRVRLWVGPATISLSFYFVNVPKCRVPLKWREQRDCWYQEAVWPVVFRALRSYYCLPWSAARIVRLSDKQFEACRRAVTSHVCASL